jgi:hypothetical protein
MTGALLLFYFGPEPRRAFPSRRGLLRCTPESGAVQYMAFQLRWILHGC